MSNNSTYAEWVRTGIVTIKPLKARVKLNSEDDWAHFISFMVEMRDKQLLDVLKASDLSAAGFHLLPWLAW